MKPDLKTQIFKDLKDWQETFARLTDLEKKMKDYENQLKPIILKVCAGYSRAEGDPEPKEITHVSLADFPMVAYCGHNVKGDGFDGDWDLDFIFDEKAQAKEWQAITKTRLKKEKLRAEESIAKTKKKSEKIRKQLEKLEVKAS